MNAKAIFPQQGSQASGFKETPIVEA
jgi:ribosomal protein S18 acetylase RimI-like enzyme